MAIPVGTNDLKIYRRHASYCTRFPSLKNKPDTYGPTKLRNSLADSPFFVMKRVALGEPNKTNNLTTTLQACDRRMWQIFGFAVLHSTHGDPRRHQRSENLSAATPVIVPASPASKISRIRTGRPRRKTKRPTP